VFLRGGGGGGDGFPATEEDGAHEV
jgi:hypothetical protein